MNIGAQKQDYPAVQFRIARPTNKLTSIIDFYTKGLRLKILYQFEGHNGYKGVMIGLPGFQYHLEFTEHDKSTYCKAPTKDNLLVFYFPDLKDLNSIKDCLDNLGYKTVKPENTYWENKSWTYEDPDGWRVVLYNGVFQDIKQPLIT